MFIYGLLIQLMRKFYNSYSKLNTNDTFIVQVGSPDIAHSIAMDYIDTPHLIVLNATTSEHHIPDDDPMEMTIDAIREFLDSIAEQRAKVN